MCGQCLRTGGWRAVWRCPPPASPLPFPPHHHHASQVSLHVCWHLHRLRCLRHCIVGCSRSSPAPAEGSDRALRTAGSRFKPIGLDNRRLALFSGLIVKRCLQVNIAPSLPSRLPRGPTEANKSSPPISPFLLSKVGPSYNLVIVMMIALCQYCGVSRFSVAGVGRHRCLE